LRKPNVKCCDLGIELRREIGTDISLRVSSEEDSFSRIVKPQHFSKATLGFEEFLHSGIHDAHVVPSHCGRTVICHRSPFYESLHGATIVYAYSIARQACEKVTFSRGPTDVQPYPR
jgi:hypothetical protein